MKEIQIALAGNPNAGKTTLFNALSGDNQHVGNWPGKTVAKRTGSFTIQQTRINVVDLPGVYSLSSYSPEEQITRDYIINHTYDLLINVVDTSNLERNLYLTVQIMETNAPMILVLNKSDLANKKGYLIDTVQLSANLGGISILQIAALKGKGLEKLKASILAFNLQPKGLPV
jgi:ferrous iron transport protein B